MCVFYGFWWFFVLFLFVWGFFFFFNWICRASCQKRSNTPTAIRWTHRDWVERRFPLSPVVSTFNSIYERPWYIIQGSFFSALSVSTKTAHLFRNLRIGEKSKKWKEKPAAMTVVFQMWVGPERNSGQSVMECGLWAHTFQEAIHKSTVPWYRDLPVLCTFMHWVKNDLKIYPWPNLPW